MLLSVVATLNPIGLDVIHAAFYSSEALSQNIWKPIALTTLVIMILIVALEWRIRKFIIHRRAVPRRP